MPRSSATSVIIPGYTPAYIRAVLSGSRPCPFVLANRLAARGIDVNSIGSQHRSSDDITNVRDSRPVSLAVRERSGGVSASSDCLKRGKKRKQENAPVGKTGAFPLTKGVRTDTERGEPTKHEYYTE